jgi:hypothetical protein
VSGVRAQQGASAPRNAFACGRCGALHDETAWRSLRVVETLDRDRVRDLVTEWPWPAATVLEVRRCRCGATIARPRIRPGSP